MEQANLSIKSHSRLTDNTFHRYNKTLQSACSLNSKIDLFCSLAYASFFYFVCLDESCISNAISLFILNAQRRCLPLTPSTRCSHHLIDNTELINWFQNENIAINNNEENKIDGFLLILVSDSICTQFHLSGRLIDW